MKQPQIPKGLTAHYFKDENGWTLCALYAMVDGQPQSRATGIARYNPNDYTSDEFPFDPNKGRAIALKRAIRNYNKGWW